MTRARKRDIEPTQEVRRSTRSKASTSTSIISTPTSTSTSIQSPKKANVEMKLPTVSKKRSEIISGARSWDRDFKKLKTTWKTGIVEGYGGLMASITGTLQSRVGAEGRF